MASIGMWVRSYYWVDSVRWNYKDASLLTIYSLCGDINVRRLDDESNSTKQQLASKMESERVNRNMSYTFYLSKQTRDVGALGFHGHFFGNGSYFAIPYWFPVAVIGTLAGLPWIWSYLRFSLRTLLIAVTILAVVLGMIAWLDHPWIGK